MMRAALLGLSVACAACAPQVIKDETFKSYSVGQVRTASIGDPFLVDQNGRTQEIKTWVGIINSPDGWERRTEYSRDFLRRELIYGGRSGSTIDVSYREFRGGLAAQSFTQNLKYDLNESKIVRFQNFQLEVQSATNQSITYKILSD